MTTATTKTAEQLRQNVALAALGWLGTPYHHHARIKGVGVDCVHLLCAVFEACGLVPPIDPGIYAPDWHHCRSAELYIAGLQQHGQEVGAPELGDVAIFKFGRTYSHAGVMVSRDEVVHAYSGMGVILTRLREEPLASRPARFFRVNALVGA